MFHKRKTYPFTIKMKLQNILTQNKLQKSFNYISFVCGISFYMVLLKQNITYLQEQ